MKHAIALLLAATLLAGCSTVGNVFKKTGKILMDPSVQVGAAEDQPTQIALSLFASLDVNPNPVSLPTTAPIEDSVPISEALEDDGPFAVNLRSGSKRELIEHLRALLGKLQEEMPSSPSALAVRQRASIPGLIVDEQYPPLTLGKTFPETLFSSTATSRGPFPANWMLRHLAQPGTDTDPWSQAMRVRELGQYNRTASIAPAADDTDATPSTATPIAFRVLQLKDDSMLENIDPELLRQDAKKALGSTLLASDDYTLVPGQFKFIEYSAIDEKTRYIAVVANFHDPNAEHWHDVFRVEPRGRKYPLMVMLQKTRVGITDESYRPSQSNSYAAAHTSTHP
ncbi:type VI secretion system lipoprotein TssJ [Pseudomonas taiwanensis]|uniref:type VI secretion system lipoprotein TssJ n=1 Tax=Pseudomonas taiwanensis TaxID=470150 RepID=UPI0015BAE2D6|nr:type VI secretion system lipoprotein TssJ [Pseudomonas taiwanensis]NWL75394.1 type VI secretion system lipoprotein TssJ [Pseudomonas taiwanensis]